jgi:uncharacterized protein YdaU (DUF1376 family)
MSDKPKRRAPAFMLYVDDFLGGTSEMSAEEVGGYIRLLCHQWSKGGLPNDPERLGRMAGLMGSPSLGYAVAKFTLCEDGQLRHPRLEALRSERDAFLIHQAESGKKGAEARWKDRQPNGKPIADPNGKPMPTPMADGCPEHGSPSPSPSPINKTPKPPRGQPVEPESFIVFWNAYPKKVAKPQALKSWLRISPNEDTVTQIIQDVTKRKASEDWTKDQGKYIPNPSTYLNNQRWTDLFEIPETKETLHAKLTSHPANPKGTQCTHATEEEKADFKAMLERYKAMP